MSNWGDFEDAVVKYLNEEFNNDATFTGVGKSDSTHPDIAVSINGEHKFYIEAKCSEAQCGQFVLFPNANSSSFKYSDGNKTPENHYSSVIINYMNSNFNTFNNVGTAGIDISFPESSEVFTNWIIDMYREKGVKFFITEGVDQFVIFKPENFSEYFDVSATYRKKRSGTSRLSKKNRLNVAHYLNQNNNAFSILEIRVDNRGKMFVSSDDDLGGSMFNCDGQTYLFSKRSHEFEIRKRSNTANPNVIFSISLKKLTGLTKNEFQQLLTT